MLTGQNGILNRATEAKEKKDVEQKKEEILLAYNSILIEKNGYQNLNYDELQKAINDQFGENKAIVSGNGEEDGVFTISFIEEKQDYNSGEQEGIGTQIYKHLMNGVTHMLPFVVGGGIGMI